VRHGRRFSASGFAGDYRGLASVPLTFQPGVLLLARQVDATADYTAHCLHVLGADGFEFEPITSEIWVVFKSKIWPQNTNKLL
jgi:hypothetical protein